MSQIYLNFDDPSFIIPRAKGDLRWNNFGAPFFPCNSENKMGFKNAVGLSRIIIK